MKLVRNKTRGWRKDELESVSSGRNVGTGRANSVCGKSRESWGKTWLTWCLLALRDSSDVLNSCSSALNHMHVLDDLEWSVKGMLSGRSLGREGALEEEGIGFDHGGELLRRFQPWKVIDKQPHVHLSRRALGNRKNKDRFPKRLLKRG